MAVHHDGLSRRRRKKKKTGRLRGNREWGAGRLWSNNGNSPMNDFVKRFCLPTQYWLISFYSAHGVPTQTHTVCRMISSTWIWYILPACSINVITSWRTRGPAGFLNVTRVMCLVRPQGVLWRNSSIKAASGSLPRFISLALAFWVFVFFLFFFYLSRPVNVIYQWCNREAPRFMVNNTSFRLSSNLQG